MLYRDAKSIVFSVTAVFFIIGVGFGLGLGSVFAANYVAPANRSLGLWIVAISSGLVTGFVGYLIGQAMAFWYRLKAQLTLCQKQIELNTRAAAQTRQMSSFEEIVP